MPPPAPPPPGRLRSFCCPRMRRGTWCREVVDCLAVWGLCPSCLRNFRWMCGLAFSPFFRGVVPLPESASKILFGVVQRQISGSTSRLRIGPQQRDGSGPLLPLQESASKILFGVVPRQVSGSTTRLRIGPQQRVGTGPLLSLLESASKILLWPSLLRVDVSPEDRTPTASRLWASVGCFPPNRQFEVESGDSIPSERCPKRASFLR